tara:strand:+ start:6086 stop:7066 length:981 start_codon:yes stop_codon:yes gene_type:complete
MSNSKYEVPTVQVDGVVKSVLDKYVGRAIVGKEKYGKTMDRKDLNKNEWLTHLQEELMDATLYIEKLKRMEEKLCVVFVTNQKYLEKFYATCSQLRSVGNYKGDVCLIIGDDLNNSEFRENEFITKNNIIVKHYPDTQFTPEFLEKQKQLNRESFWVEKLFQYHKLYLFTDYFKKWDYIFYLDCGITILNDITPMMEIREKNTLLAHSDSYPKYNNNLDYQFDTFQPEFQKLRETYSLNKDYPQTTIMLFDTCLIEDDMRNKLWELAQTYPISVTNDQGIIALHFTCINPVFKQIPMKNNETYFYDYFLRNYGEPYIMVKDTVFGH